MNDEPMNIIGKIRLSVSQTIQWIALRVYPEDVHDMTLRDDKGNLVMTISLGGWFVMSGPAEGYKIYCRHYENDDDMVGVEEEI